MIALAIEIDAEEWHAVQGIEELCRRAATAATASAPEASSGPASATLLLADDEALRELNRAWRGLDKPTNVLSFPAPGPGPGFEDGRILGDIAIAWETVRREAAEEGKTVDDHLAHLVVHGVLHLLGLDHEDEAQAEAMEALEVEALARIGVADPYRATA